jgi:hypothetical protein
MQFRYCCDKNKYNTMLTLVNDATFLKNVYMKDLTNGQAAVGSKIFKIQDTVYFI